MAGAAARMKLAFVTLVAAATVLVHAHVDGDQGDIYTGIQDTSPFDKQDDDYSPLFPQLAYALPRMRGSFPWTRDRKPAKAANGDYDRMADEIRRELAEMIERRRQQMKVDAAKNIQYLSPHQNILDDPRPYAIDEQDGEQEIDDGDFSFTGDDTLLDNSDSSLTQSEQLYLGRLPYSRLNPWEDIQRDSLPVRYDSLAYGQFGQNEGGDLHKSGHHTDDMVQEDVRPALPVSGSGMFKDVEFVKDPAEFAYPPSDPRFFEDKTRHETIEETLARMNKVNVKTLSLNHNKNTYSFLNRLESSSESTGKLQKTNDDYDFLTNDEAPYEQEQTAPVEMDKSLLHDMDINVKHRNDLESNANSRDFLRNDQDVEVIPVRMTNAETDSTGIYILAIIAGVSAAALVTLITLVITWFNLQKHVKNASDAEYPAYGVTGPNKEVSPSGDRRLAQSAQMYHYQHQKQQIIAMERAAATERHGSISEADSEEENEEGDYTVYECPGLAPTGEMEVKNPMFQDDPTPAQTPQLKQTDASATRK